MTTVRLNDEIEDKLNELTRAEHTSKSEIIKKALQEYYANHIKKSSPFELGQDLFGKHSSGQTDNSTTYKNKLRDKLNAKHAH